MLKASVSWINCIIFGMTTSLASFAYANSQVKYFDDKNVTISLGTDALKILKTSSFLSHEVKEIRALSKQGASLIQIPIRHLGFLSHIVHSKLNRCGGFFLEDDDSPEDGWVDPQVLDIDYSLTEDKIVHKLLPEVAALNIKNTILSLSEFKNRYYRSRHGVSSQEWVLQKWKTLAQNRSDVTVETINHNGFPQPSVIMTVKGESEEIIVIGGHGDSITGWMPNEDDRAPGADDNASGIASITEVIRILMEGGFRGKKTLQFISYAAEEVGLVGSKEIAKRYFDAKKKVIGVMQLDMTNFRGSSNDIVLMSDFTNPRQNEFFVSLIKTYLPTAVWAYDQCGYACSDHASWTRYGFPASIPFESTMNSDNPKIHTPGDLLENASKDAEHSVNFSKLALSFALEMAKSLP